MLTQSPNTPVQSPAGPRTPQLGPGPVPKYLIVAPSGVLMCPLSTSAWSRSRPQAPPRGSWFWSHPAPKYFILSGGDVALDAGGDGSVGPGCCQLGGTSGRPHPRAALGFGVLRLELCPRRAFGASINNRCTLGLIKASRILHSVEGSCYFLPEEKCIFFLVPRALRTPRGSQVRWQQRRRVGFLPAGFGVNLGEIGGAERC